MHLTIRADGSSDIGFGHLVRTSALATEFHRNGHQVTCVTTTPNEARSVFTDATEILALNANTERDDFPDWILKSNPDIVLTDSYQIDTEYQQSLNTASKLLAVILDDNRYSICADFLINGNIYATGLEYEWTGTEPEWRLGLDYIPLRDEIRKLANNTPPWRDFPGRAIVTLGGSDIRQSMPTVLSTFDGIDVDVEAIIGPGFSSENRNAIHEAASEIDANVELVKDPPDLSERMFEADFAVSACGITVYELLTLGTPTIGLHLARNQVPIAKELEKSGAILHADPNQTDDIKENIAMMMTNSSLRRKLRETGLSLVDCKGAKRIYNVLMEAYNSHQ